MAEHEAERMREQEALLRPKHDTSGLDAELRQFQAEVEAQQLQGKIRLGLARGEIDPTAANDEQAG